ncbi:MAG: BamA/TamA family outer membrane protein [Myxococcota bacterium]
MTPLIVCMVLAGDAEPDAAEDNEELTSEEFRERQSNLAVDILQHALRAPEYAMELALTPLGLLVSATERYRLHERIPDLLQNEDGTIRLTPDFKLSVGQGAGGGATLSFRSLTRDEAKLALGLLYRVNFDRQFHARVKRRFSVLEGRELSFGGSLEVDRDREWFGIGGNTQFSDRRTVRDETLGADFTMDLRHRGAKRYTGDVSVGFLRQTLLPGEGPRAPPVGSDEDVATPPGFERTLDFARAGVSFQFSNIDSEGRPTRGGIVQANTRAVIDVNSDGFSALHSSVRAVQYFEILPRNRVVALKAGANAAVPLRGGDTVPFDELVSYGGSDVLRGYRRGRFRDELGWWAAAEYGFPVYELGGLGFALAPTFFFDVGQVSGAVDEFSESPLHYSGGVGLTASHDLFWALTFSLGFSPDGAQLSIELGEAFF